MKWKFLLLTLALISVLCLTSALGIGCFDDGAPMLPANTDRMYCSLECTWAMAEDDECDSVCDTSSCQWDNHRCDSDYCAPDCKIAYIIDDYCNPPCNNAACNWDGGGCSGTEPDATEYAVFYCAPGCPWDHVGDGNCDAYYCDNPACNYDGGDCTCAAGCTTEMLNNDVCDWACNLAACYYDNGRCN